MKEASDPCYPTTTWQLIMTSRASQLEVYLARCQIRAAIKFLESEHISPYAVYTSRHDELPFDLIGGHLIHR